MARSASRRDTPIVAWHAVPGKACPGKRPSRRVRYVRAYLIPEVFFIEMCAVIVRPKAFSNIRIQDRNTFLCAENAMNVQAREGVCHEANYILDSKRHNINCGRYFAREQVGLGIEPVRTPAPITPYPTGRLVWGALSQALRARLRVPPGHFATASN
jgi:hypothetical protein